jgi:hypothetical protein
MADIRRIGADLNAIGGTKLMKAALDRALKPHFEYCEWLSDWCDKTWDGIGGWMP